MLRGYDVTLLRVLLFLYHYLCYDVTRLRCYAVTCIVICYHDLMLRGYDVTLLLVLLFVTMI